MTVHQSAVAATADRQRGGAIIVRRTVHYPAVAALGLRNRGGRGEVVVMLGHRRPREREEEAIGAGRRAA
jgi:hypothetical protein